MLRLKAESATSGSAGQQRVKTWFFDEFGVSSFPLAEQHRIAVVTVSDSEIFPKRLSVFFSQKACSPRRRTIGKKGKSTESSSATATSPSCS